MSFLANYWKAVERAVTETGMNAGDIVIDITTVGKNTEEPDVVESQVNVVTEPQPTEPAKAGTMPQHKTDFEARDALARRSARPSEELEERSLTETPTREKTVKQSIRVCMDHSDTGEPVRPNQTKKERRALRKDKVKRLKKLGGGRKVRLIIDEVHLNDRTVWKSSGTDG